jgi:hypothetical protein
VGADLRSGSPVSVGPEIDMGRRLRFIPENDDGVLLRECLPRPQSPAGDSCRQKLRW